MTQFFRVNALLIHTNKYTHTAHCDHQRQRGDNQFKINGTELRSYGHTYDSDFALIQVIYPSIDWRWPGPAHRLATMTTAAAKKTILLFKWKEFGNGELVIRRDGKHHHYPDCVSASGRKNIWTDAHSQTIIPLNVASARHNDQNPYVLARSSYISQIPIVCRYACDDRDDLESWTATTEQQLNNSVFNFNFTLIIVRGQFVYRI